MKQEDIRAIVNQCINPHILCRFHFKYDSDYYYFFPLLANDKLFIGLEEDDFITDGFSVRRFKDVIDVEIKDDFCLRILASEGIVEKIETPLVDISTWKSVFESLQNMNIFIIVEKESIDEEKAEFIIGRIEKILESCTYIRHFDGDGIWQAKPQKIRYSEITSVTFHSRYVDTFSKYLSELPPNIDIN